MALIIFVTTVLCMMLSFVFFPKIKVKKIELNTHWMIILFGALCALIFTNIDYQLLIDAVFMNNAMNPMKLITFFISMTMLSIYLNQIGVFEKFALFILSKIKSSQKQIFTVFSLMVGILTIFVSNDVIILTLVPIAIYFARGAKINPLPYVFSVLVFANTFSLTLMIGNPTNIYLALNQNISFIDYAKVMIIPSLFTALTSFTILYFIFRKDLKKPIELKIEVTKPISKVPLIIGLSHMMICLVLLVLSNAISIEMWLITLIAATSLLILSFLYYKFKNESIKPVIQTIKLAPWSFVPLILGMYVLVEAMRQQGIHLELFNFLSHFNPIYGYGISSFLLSNVMNNLPMTMFYATVIENGSNILLLPASYATIIGANLGVLFTPFGALAGLMWFDLIKANDIEITILGYIKKLFILGVASLVVTLFVLDFMYQFVY